MINSDMRVISLFMSVFGDMIFIALQLSVAADYSPGVLTRQCGGPKVYDRLAL